MNNGTPKTLEQSILNALMVGPLNEADVRVKASVRDFLAQKFTTAIVSAEINNEKSSVEALKKLWNKLTGEEM